VSPVHADPLPFSTFSRCTLSFRLRMSLLIRTLLLSRLPFPFLLSLFDFFFWCSNMFLHQLSRLSFYPRFFSFPPSTFASSPCAFSFYFYFQAARPHIWSPPCKRLAPSCPYAPYLCHGSVTSRKVPIIWNCEGSGPWVIASVLSST